MKAFPPTKKIRALEAALVRQQEKLAALRRRQPPEPVADYTQPSAAGPVKLSALVADGVGEWKPQYRY
ncbi:MAG: hypothetical protein HY736_23260 [Verrucomicrobia bacterium]|nr:hypothetical protein [Verrucomicrobiota bacterium]